VPHLRDNLDICVQLCSVVVMEFKSPYRKDKSVTRTMRINEGIDDILKNEAKKRGVSVNTLLDQYLTRYAESYRFFENLSATVLSPQTLTGLLHFIEEEEAENLGAKLGKERPLELLLKRGVQPSYLAAKWYLTKVLGAHSGWFSSSVNETEGKELIHLSHPFGLKWSKFLKGYLGSFFNEILGFYPETQILSGSVTFTIDTKDIR
jgi:hypothetical protein